MCHQAYNANMVAVDW